jgi:diphosphomevalonate decarboxylase
MKTYSAKATARSNIALSKYWGKVDTVLNLPAVPSISLTLDGFETTTRVTFDAKLKRDEVEINGKQVSDKERKRVVKMLDRVRKMAKFKSCAHVSSRSNFPKASGLASSASGFAALAAAASAAAGLKLSEAELSALARQSSASAARSIFGGFVELPAGQKRQAKLGAHQLAKSSHWNLQMVVAMVGSEEKKIGSTQAMERARKTSPYYQAWLREAPNWNRKIANAIKKRNLDALGAAMEASTFAFHSTCFTSQPPIFFWSATTLALIRAVADLRDEGVSVWCTMDAGPHVKALCQSKDAAKVKRALEKVSGVSKVRIAKPGAGVICKIGR